MSYNVFPCGGNNVIKWEYAIQVRECSEILWWGARQLKIFGIKAF